MFQIFACIGDEKMQPHRIYEEFGQGAEKEALDAFDYECYVAQRAADHTRKPVSVELRDIENGYILAHKRFMPLVLQ